MAQFLRQMGLSSAASFSRRLGTGLRAGVGILRLLEIESNSGSIKHQYRMGQVLKKVRAGEALSVAMNAAEGYFPKLLIQMVHVGETTGRMERTVLEMAELFEHRVKMRRILIGGIAWPLIQLFMSILIIGAVIWLQGVLGPASGPAYDALGLGLYGTRGVMIYFAWVGFAFACVIGVFIAVRQNVFGLNRLVPYTYKLPMIGAPLQTISLSRICWTLALTLDAGVDVIRSVRLALSSAGSVHYEMGGARAEQAIRQGATLAGACQAAGVFPKDFIEVLEIAEVSGTDAESLTRLAANYDERAKMAIGALVAVATGAIWLTVVAILVFVIMRMALNYIGLLNSALQM